MFKRDGSSVVRQQVVTGAMNDDEIVITRGLSENDRVLLSPPADKDKLTLVRLIGVDGANGRRRFGKGPPGGTGQTQETEAGYHEAGCEEANVNNASATGQRQEAVSRRRQFVEHGAFALRTAIEAVGHNKMRAALTSLGILFGVASVIAMLAIGKGAEQEILAQMRLLGTNNIVITPIDEQKEGEVKDQKAVDAAQVHARTALR